MDIIRPVHTEGDYQVVMKEIDDLLAVDSAPDSPEAERLELLSILIEDFEKKHHPIAPPDDPVEVILYYMDQRGLTRKDLEPYIGDRARVSDILGRRRSLSLSMIRRLHQGLGIPADLLIADPKSTRYMQIRGARIFPAP